MIELLNYPVNDLFYNLTMESKKNIKLCAPYVKASVIKKIYETKRESVPLEIISNFNIGNFHKGASDIEAFKYIVEKEDKVYNSQMLHAKLYISDDKYTIITSANLTSSGFNRNIEYGTLIKDMNLVNQTMIDYNNLCNHDNTGIITLNILGEIQDVLKVLPKDNIRPNYDIETDNILEIDVEKLRNNISTWKMLLIRVIEEINSVEFTLSEVYQFEGAFKKQYPNNNTIRNSIRRNLQELRDMGLIKFLGSGRYLKLWENK